MKKAIFYYLFSSVSLLGDSIFLYFLSFNLLNFKHGGILSGLVLGIDSFFQVALGPYLARLVDAIPFLKKRILISFWMQISLIVLALLPGFLTSYSLSVFILLIFFFIIMRFFSLIDSQLKVVLPLYFEHHKVFPLIRSLSFSNISLRGVHMVSTSLAPMLIGMSWISICSLNSVSYIFSAAGIYFILMMVNKYEEFFQRKNDSPSESNKTLIEESEKRKWTKWNNHFLLLSNLSFGSIALILSKEMLLYKNDSVITQVVYGPAPLYGGLFFALLLMIAFPEVMKSFVKNARMICITVFGFALTLILSAISLKFLHAGALFLSGILYGMTLIGVGAFIQPKIKGAQYVKAMASAQAFGKVGTLVSLFAAGICIDYNFAPSQLLIFFATFGGIGTLYLFYKGSKLEQKATFRTPL